MDSLVQKKERENPISPESASFDLLQVIQGMDTINELQSYLELECPELDDNPPTRKEIRELFDYAHQEELEDKVAGTPKSIIPLSRKIDDNINKVIDLITEENRVLAKIAANNDNQLRRIKSTEEELTPEEARGRILSNTEYLLNVKKHLNEQRKAEQGPGNPNVALDINMNLGTVLQDALSNIKNAEIIDSPG